jgi:hypothetical protein
LPASWAGTALSNYGGLGAYNFCSVTPPTNAGAGYIEIILQPQRAFASLNNHYNYEGKPTATPGISGAVWRRTGSLVYAVVFKAGVFAVAFATNLSKPPYPSQAKYVALAAAIRRYLG